MKRSLLLLLPGLLLAACTGTEESTPPTRLAVLTDGGASVRTVTVGGTGVTPAPADPSVTVNGGVTLDTLPGGKRLALTLTGGIESRDVDLADVQPFAPPFEVAGFVSPPCLKTTVLNAQRDRLLTLSQCGSGGTANGTQQLALYRTDGTLVWRAALPVAFTPTDPDAPPVRLALVREGTVDIGIVARPALGGGSEVLRAAVPTSRTGSDLADVSAPVSAPAIRDLAPAPGGSVVYAATDTGVQPLTGTGIPDAAATLPAFGTARVDRLWTGVGSGAGGNLIAAWRDTTLTGGGSEPLRLWDGTRSSAAVVAYVSELRDVTFALDGNLYALTRTSLTSYDTLFGLTQGNWRATTLLSNLNDARAVTWLVP
ncbi:hypothetical protein DEIPH_ctg023orf0026 [Deinococcus phoenicis]|uniref:Lipoprotein n=1 Tax=Deinococcus phoenicis TaxID=1476583 RepID=A0A016QQS7_9DEIO|nr:hypothetical protein [Deinococcus phoenicis]EYB68438.1 hypothetical protein DEIPH_ctg023orf0026 [Deinococcus phoenicis]